MNRERVKGDGGKSRGIMKAEGGRKKRKRERDVEPQRSNNAGNELYCASFTCKRKEEETAVIQQREKR